MEPGVPDGENPRFRRVPDVLLERLVPMLSPQLVEEFQGAAAQGVQLVALAQIDAVAGLKGIAAGPRFDLHLSGAHGALKISPRQQLPDRIVHGSSRLVRIRAARFSVMLLGSGGRGLDAGGLARSVEKLSRFESGA